MYTYTYIVLFNCIPLNSIILISYPPNFNNIKKKRHLKIQSYTTKEIKGCRIWDNIYPCFVSTIKCFSILGSQFPNGHGWRDSGPDPHYLTGNFSAMHRYKRIWTTSYNQSPRNGHWNWAERKNVLLKHYPDNWADIREADRNYNRSNQVLHQEIMKPKAKNTRWTKGDCELTSGTGNTDKCADL